MQCNAMLCCAMQCNAMQCNTDTIQLYNTIPRSTSRSCGTARVYGMARARQHARMDRDLPKTHAVPHTHTHTHTRTHTRAQGNSMLTWAMSSLISTTGLAAKAVGVRVSNSGAPEQPPGVGVARWVFFFVRGQGRGGVSNKKRRCPGAAARGWRSKVGGLVGMCWCVTVCVLVCVCWQPKQWACA